MTDMQEPTEATAPATRPTGRSTPKFVIGLVMTIVGGLFLLGSLTRFAAGLATSSGAAEAAGRVVGGLVLPVVIVVIGIVLLATSRRK